MGYRFTVNLKGEKLIGYSKQNFGLPTSEFDWLGMKEKTYLIALVCDLSNKNMEKKQ